MSVLLITEEDIKKDSPIGGNVDVAKLIPAIKQAQITVIKPFLGKLLYDRIVKDFEDNTLEGFYLEAYEDYIKSMLIHISTAFYLTTGAYSISNKGIFKGGDEFSEGLTRLEIDYMVKAQEKYFNSYKKELFDFLNNNIIEIAEWNSNDKRTKNGIVRVGSWSIPVNDREIEKGNQVYNNTWKKRDW